MVDLVKIRKKAKEQKQSEPADGGVGDEGGEASAPSQKDPAPEKSSSHKKPKRSKRDSGGSTPGKKTAKKTKKTPEPRVETEVEEAGGLDEGRDEEVSKPDEEPTASAVRTDQDEKAETKLSEFKRTAGVSDSRQEETTEDDEIDAGAEQLELITFSLANEQYAMEVGRLVEIIVPRQWTRVPNADETIIGIISLRGSIVTLIDLRRLLGHPGRGRETEDTRIIVVQNESEQVGFIVDRVLRVVKVDEDSIEPHPVVSSSEQNEAVRGVFVSGDTITIYLDLERIAG